MTTTGVSAPMLSVRDLSVNYSARAAVIDVNFTIAPGESLGLVGESGSGKSTIARALLRLIPARGSVVFQGQDLLSARGQPLRTLRRTLQIIFQDPVGALDPRMTVAELVAEPLREFHPELARAARHEATTAILAKVGMGSEQLSRLPHQLSGGQAQRVGIARALILQPKLLVCDEPTAALDVSIKSQIANLLRQLRAEFGLSLLFISHDLATVRFLSDRICVLYRGRIVEQAPRDALFDAPRHPYTRALLRASAAAAATAAELRPEPRPPATGCAYRPLCAVAVARCATEVPALRQLGPTQVACHHGDD